MFQARSTMAELKEESITIEISIPAGWSTQESVGNHFRLNEQITLYFIQKTAQSPSPQTSGNLPSASSLVIGSLSPLPTEAIICPEGTELVKEECVGIGLISITATWSVYGEGDLHVATPNHWQINYRNDTDPTGGYLDVDGYDFGPENVYWAYDTHPSAGTYYVCFDDYDGDIGYGSGTYTITIKVAGKPPRVVTGSPGPYLSYSYIICDPSSPIYVTSFTYP